MKFEMRAAQIDLARQIETVDTVKRFFDVAAGAGLNTIVMYLEDRVKTATYPYSPDVESYSEAQVREMVAYADTLGLELIPVVSPIGHTERFLRHPELAQLAELRGNIPGMFAKGTPDDMHMDTCPRLAETMAFFDAYITEVAALFPSKYFHIGFDEIHEMGFCELCKGTPVAELFGGAVKHFYDLLKGLGKEVMIWDDMLEQQPKLLELIPKDVILCAWFYQYTEQYPTARFETSSAYDYLTYYERLGYRTLACPNKRGSLDTLTTYAAKCHTMGMLLTSWEMSNHQQLAYLYPQLTYAGLLWTGKEVPGPAALEKAAAQYVDTPAAAKALATAMSAVRYCGVPLPGDKARYPLPREWEYTMENMLPLVIDVLENATGDKDVIDAYLAKLHVLQLRFRLWETGYALHEYRAGVGSLTIEELRREAAACAKQADAVTEEITALWDRLRSGLPYSSAFRNEQKMYRAAADWLVKTAENAVAGEIGRLVIRYELREFTSACKTVATVHYADGSSFEAANGTYKAMYERAVQYDYSYEIPADKVPVAVTLTVSGYGASGFRYVSANVGGKEYVPEAVLSASGQVEHAEFMLDSDTRAAMFNEQDMMQFFTNDISAKREHSVTLSMKEW